jgi:hypothetical protein
VRALSETGMMGPFSAPGVAEISLPEPVLGSAYTFTEQGSLEWEPVPLAEQYIVQVSANREMASFTEKQTGDAEVPLDLASGPAFVRVAAANAAGERVSGFSQVATVTLEAPLHLIAPALITPPKGAKVKLPKSGRISIVFSWKPVENAAGYYVEISQQPNFKKTIQKRTVRNSKWVLKGAKFDGKIYWRVRSEGKDGKSAWSRPGFFEVR